MLICYDRENDNTLPAIKTNLAQFPALPIELVRNRGIGAHSAVLTGFAQSSAPIVLMLPADDDYNAGRLDGMVAMAQAGHDIVCASRFMKGGSMTGCPWLKAFLVRAANFTLYHFARLPTRDASNGFRLFSRRVVDDIAIESDDGFLLRDRITGEMPPARLAYRRGAGAVDRAPAGNEPLPGGEMAAGLSALVSLCVRHDIFATQA